MENFKIGDVVARRSYNMDVLFKIVNIRDNVVDLVGLTVRISADSLIQDLVHMSEYEINSRIKNFENMKNARMNRCYNHVQRRFNIRNENYNYNSPIIYTKEKILKKPGVILHIDADYFCYNSFEIKLK